MDRKIPLTFAIAFIATGMLAAFASANAGPRTFGGYGHGGKISFNGTALQGRETGQDGGVVVVELQLADGTVIGAR